MTSPSSIQVDRIREPCNELKRAFVRTKPTRIRTELQIDISRYSLHRSRTRILPSLACLIVTDSPSMFQVYTRRRRHRHRHRHRPVAVEEPGPVLADDFIEDILARLPAKAVYRCRALSRTWVARLASDEFPPRQPP